MIGNSVFYSCTEATVKLPASVQTIEEVAFGIHSSRESLCKKVLVKTGADFDRIKQLVKDSGYPENRIGQY